MPKSPTDSQVQTVDRVHAIINCFSNRAPYLGLTEISERIDLPKSTTHRLVSSMVHNGLLGRAPDGRRYMLGYQFLRWADIVANTLDLPMLAKPFLTELATRTGETAVLMVRDGDWAICLDKVDSSHSLRLDMTVGKRIWLHAGSSAKILMAHLAPDEIDRIIDETKLPQVLENTITAPHTLRAELAQIRAQGYATSSQERDPDAAGVSAPIFNGADEVIAGLGIVGPASRVIANNLELINAVQSVAQALSGQIGHKK